MTPGTGGIVFRGIRGYILLIASAITVTIRPLDEFFENHKITLGTRIYLSTVIFIILSGLFFFGK